MGASRELAKICLVAAGGVLLVAVGSATAQVSPESGALTVEQCVAYARENSNALKQAETSVESANGSLRMAMQAILPSVSTGANYSRTEFPESVERFQWVDGLPTTGFSDLAYSGTVYGRAQQSILDMEGFTNWRSSKAQLQAARMEFVAAESDVEESVRQQFYACLAALKLAEVEDNAVEVASEQLRRAETLFNLGSVARSDVLQARVNLAESDMNALNRRNGVRVEHSRLALIIGFDPRLNLTIDSTLVIPPDDPDQDFLYWIDKALARRADVSAALQRLRAAELAEAAAKLGRLPTLGADVTWSRRANSYFDSQLSDGSQTAFSSSWSASLGLNLTLFNGFSREGRIQRAVAATRSRRASLDQLENEVALEVKDAFLSIRKERESLRSAESSVRLAQENLRLQQALYESGAGTLLEWDNARLDLRRSRVSMIQAQINLLLSQIRFDKAIGE